MLKQTRDWLRFLRCLSISFYLVSCSTTKYHPKISPPPKFEIFLKIDEPDISQFPQISFKMFMRDTSGLPLLNQALPFCDTCNFWQAGLEMHPKFSHQKMPRFQVTEHRPAIIDPRNPAAHFQQQYTVIVIDISASMSGAPLQQAKQAAKKFIRRTDAEIALISFESESVLVQDFTTHENSLLESVEKLTTSGGTRLYNALYQALKLIKTKSGKQSIIALTDGETGGDDYTLEEIIALAKVDTNRQPSGTPPDIRIFPVGLNFQSETLQTLAQATRGRFFYAKNQQELYQIFTQLSDSLRTEFYYAVSFESPFPSKDGTRRKSSFFYDNLPYQITYRAPLDDSKFEFSGTVYDKYSKVPLPNAKVIAKKSHLQTHSFTLSDTSGNFKMNVPRYMGRYTFIVEGPPAYFLALTDTFLDLRGRYYFNKDLFLEPLKKNATLVLQTIFFPRNEYSIGSISLPDLRLLGDYFHQHPEIQFEISGYTDNNGTQAHNQILSEKRAQSVRDLFISVGVPPQNIQAIGYGETRPLLPNTSPANRKMNRRVEIRLTKISRE